MEKVVFVLKGYVEYEADEVLGVYSTVTEAENAMIDHKRTVRYDPFDRYSITKFILNESAVTDDKKSEEEEPRPFNSYDIEMIE